jgi:hypothetical protein
MNRQISFIGLHVVFLSIAAVSWDATASVDTGDVAMAVFSPRPNYPYEARKW